MPTRQVLVLACRKASVEVVRALLALLLPEGVSSTSDSVVDVADVAEASPTGSHAPVCSDFDIGKCSTTKGLTPLLYDVRLSASRGRSRSGIKPDPAPTGVRFGARPR